MGLGLSVVYGIVAGHRGTVAARSTPGEGSEFTISFPMLVRPCTAARVETATVLEGPMSARPKGYSAACASTSAPGAIPRARL